MKKMAKATRYIDDEEIEVPPSAALKLDRDSGYGSVEGLDDEELADPVEIERQVILRELHPILSLPRKKQYCDIIPAVDESGGIDWGAFGSVDFDRLRPAFDRARYKVDKLREELKDVLIMLSIVHERLPDRKKYLVLKYLKMGWIGIDDIANEEMRSIARWYLRAEKLRQQIRALRFASADKYSKKPDGW
jgi:hypothetical protein